MEVAENEGQIYSAEIYYDLFLMAETYMHKHCTPVHVYVIVETYKHFFNLMFAYVYRYSR